MTDFGGFLGLAEHVKLGIYAKTPLRFRNTLSRSSCATTRTPYTARRTTSRTFTPLRTIRQRFLSRYKDYEKYIDRMVETGERNLITRYRIHRYAESSGSIGKPKLVPLAARSLWNCQCFSFSAPVGCAVKWFHAHGKRLPLRRVC